MCRANQCLTWDFHLLYNKFREIKEAYPDESMVNLAADDTIRFGTVVATMDSFRVKLEEERYDDAQKFNEANPKRDADGQPELLFSDVVMAVAQ